LREREKKDRVLTNGARFPTRMPGPRKENAQPGNGNAAKNGDGDTLCALCGSVINAGTNPQGPAIYSICVTCKKLPHRNPGSTASLN